MLTATVSLANDLHLSTEGMLALSSEAWAIWLPQLLVEVFLLVLLVVLVQSPQVFLKRHGRRHAATGATYLVWIVLGFFDTLGYALIPHIFYDSLLGLLGITLTLTAAFEFQHKNIQNIASGTLDEHATVTYDEMIEHAFYQGLNLAQILFMHSLELVTEPTHRILLTFLVTSPWLFRQMFPVNRFSDNYLKIDPKSSDLVRFLYFIKKYQYVFYKHFLLHGLNISLSMFHRNIVHSPDFRLYWILLNLSFVMEFFLQTLVKKKRLSQSTMLTMQHILMAASSIAALAVLKHVSIWISVLSTVLNFVNRKRDFMNTALVVLTSYIALHSK